MSLYAIGDLHLSLKVNKPMDVFGPGWADHVRRLEEGFSPLGEDEMDLVLEDPEKNRKDTLLAELEAAGCLQNPESKI